MLKLKYIGIVILLAIVGIGIGCDGQTDEANKLVNEANDIITKSNDLVTKSNKLSEELLGEPFKKVEDLEKHKADNKAKFDELIKLNDDLAKANEDAAAKFDQISKMKVDDKFKEYNTVKSQQLKKLAEMSKADSAFVKNFLAENDAEKVQAMIVDSNKKTADMKKEADALKEKADKIVKDNPSVFGK